MAPQHDRLAALAALERRFDGPIPAPLRRLARHGTARALRLLEARGQAAFFREMTLGQLRAIRLRCAEGSAYPEMLEDLALYRRQWRRWRERARGLARRAENASTAAAGDALDSRHVAAVPDGPVDLAPARLMRRFGSIGALAQAVGEELGASPWLPVTQAMIDRFAAATGDFQWIHLDRERARHSPFGTTVAHGYLTLSLIPRLRDRIFAVDGVALSLNYGLDKLRFLEPVSSGSRVRLRLRLLAAEPARQGLRIVLAATVECQGAPRPALVAELIALLLPG